EETQKLQLLRENIRNKEPLCKDLDDSTLGRFLRARDLDVEKASAMFLKYRRWRSSFVPDGTIDESQIQNEIAQNKMFCQGKDKNGCPVAVVLGSRHFARKQGVDEFKRFLVFALDKLCSSRVPEGQEKFTIIGDLQGFGYKNSDFHGYIAAISILQDFYPERLGRVFVVRAPFIFTALWKIICPFIDQNTKKKIVFVESDKLEATLSEDIDESQLPEMYGGNLQLVPIHNA
ncbi:hypothetical protein M569_10040, partial [Genlisea aurea]